MADQQRAPRTRKFTAAAGLTLNCLDHGGQGNPPMLLLHGGSAHAHWWDFVAPALTQKFHVLALDQRGHGDSEWAPRWEYGSRHYVADLAALIAGWGLGAPVLAGHSMGGHNAMLFAAEHGAALRGLVAIDTTPDYTQHAVDFLRSFADRPPRRFPSLKEARANFRLLPRETLASPAVLDHIAGHTFRRSDDGSWSHKLDRRTLIREPLDVWSALKDIPCPALIVKAGKSPMLDREVARKMARAIPDARVIEIEESYHHVMLDNPSALIAALGEFARRL